MKKIAALSMAAVMLTSCFVGCGSKSSSKDTDVKGKWEASKMVMGDQTFEGELAPGVPLAVMMQLELKDDGKLVEKSETGDNNEGTYTVDGDKVTLEIDGDKVEFKVDGDTMVGSEEEDGEKMEFTLKKVSEFTTVAANADED